MSTDTEVIEKEKTIILVREPSMYKVILHNDNTTSMDFVIMILTKIFHKCVDDAVRIMLDIHEKGQGIAGAPYTKEIAEEKVMETLALSRANGFQLVASFEEV